jgi:mannobiose 2-epimerase
MIFTRSLAHLIVLLSCLLCWSTTHGQPVGPRSVPEYATWFRAQLTNQIMPYWEKTVDAMHGGFVLSDNPARPGQTAREKQLVTQARMIWGFSHVVNAGFEPGQGRYLEAARQGFKFLEQHFYDPTNGGYFWTTDLQGNPLNKRKIVYGQAFVIYALVEYYRASGDSQALERAIGLFQTLQTHAHDKRHGGWIEHFEADWIPVPFGDPNPQVEVAGYKSANTHLHLMEAFTELYMATKDREVKRALQESLKVNQRSFYPKHAEKSCFHRQPDWKPVQPVTGHLSYGHNVEFAWLMVRAQNALGSRPDWGHFFAHIDHALKYGWDSAHGGLYQMGRGNEPAHQTDKVWWVQAEMLAALIEARRQRPHDPRYESALLKLLDFVREHQADPRDGIWYDTVAAAGAVKNPAKAHNWKGNYHDVRAIVRLIREQEKMPRDREGYATRALRGSPGTLQFHGVPSVPTEKL